MNGLKLYTEAEIDILLKGDRREVDRLILQGLNGLAAVLIPHSEREDRIIGHINDLGGIQAIISRSKWLDAHIANENLRKNFWAKMYEKIQVAGIWAGIGLLCSVGIYYWNGHMPTTAQITSMGLKAK